jgi:hypothetical protein
MKAIRSGWRVLWYESFGFGFILLLCWLNKVVDLPHLLVGGEAHASKWRDSAIETVMILLVWAFVLSVTRRLVMRLHYLEDWLRVCAWCRKVSYAGKWMFLEEYFAEGFHVGTTHGVCPECLKKLQEDTKLLYSAQVQAQQALEKRPEPTKLAV